MEYEMKSKIKEWLLREEVVIVYPTLATALGLNEAIFLQRLMFRLNVTEEGWYRRTMEEWQEELPWWSVSTIKRIITGLKEAGIVLVRTDRNKFKIDNTSWYSIDFEILIPIRELHEESVSRPVGQNDLSNGSKWSSPAIGQNDLNISKEEEEKHKKEKGGGGGLQNEETSPRRPGHFKDFIAAYERIWGMMVPSPYIGEKIAEWADKVTLPGWEYALEQSVVNGALGKWAYLEKVLMRVEREGIPSTTQPSQSQLTGVVDFNLEDIDP